MDTHRVSLHMYTNGVKQPYPPPEIAELTFLDVPEITDIKRLRLEPGDSLVVRMDRDDLTAELAEQIKNKVRAILRLPEEIPVLVLGSEIDVEVLSRGSG